MEKTYQMLWDCTYCGQKKLLGLSHRFCANCGAPQNPALRYYPSDAEKVAVEDHQFAGADVGCPTCQQYSSRHANNCVHCGAPLAGGKAAATRQAQVAAQGVAFQGESAQDARRDFGAPPGSPYQGVPGGGPFPGAQGAPQPAKKGSSVGLVIGVIIAVILGMGMIGLFCWKKSGSFEVVGHSWSRSIAVETFGPVRDQAWCDEMPAGAKEMSRSKEKRSTRKVEDGQECKTVRKDQGDGTFKERQECKPKYRDEPVYGERCTYEINRWKKTRDAEAKGTSLSDAPRWPESRLGRTGSCVGCEREGARSETYTVRLKDIKSGKEDTCDFDQGKWASFAVGSAWDGKQAVITGSIDCDSLKKK